MRWNARRVPRASVAPRVYPLERRTGAADAAEDDERILRHGLPHELGARLDLPVDPLRELLRLLPRRGAGDDVPEPARHAVALRLEPSGELGCLVARAALDAHLPRRASLGED